jgi:hypothetical protein
VQRPGTCQWRGGFCILGCIPVLGRFRVEIRALGELRGFLGGQKVTLLWDGLPAHRSKAMRAWLGRQRYWLVVERLPGHAPELNPVEALWANLKGVELANLAGKTSMTSSWWPSVASDGSGTPTTWPTRSCDTAACRCGDHVTGKGDPRFLGASVIWSAGRRQCAATCRRPANRRARPATAHVASVQAAPVPPAPSK